MTVEFNDGVDLNVAAADMRDAISRVANNLPEEADPSRIIKADSNADPVMRLAVTSDTMAVDDMTVLVEDQIEDVLSAVPGVADVQINGDRDKIFRIDIDQARLASYGLTIADISNALSSMGLDAPAGSLRSSDQSIVVRATANLEKPEDFENVYIKGAHADPRCCDSHPWAGYRARRCAPTARPPSASASCVRRSRTRSIFRKACAQPRCQFAENPAGRGQHYRYQ